MTSANSGIESCKSRDILSRPALAFVAFGLPTIAILVAGTSYFSDLWRTLVWAAALTVMGAACIVNARRCGRVHCYATGPFFVVMAVVTLLYGFGVLPLGRGGWNPIGLAILVGAIALCCLPEVLFGKYRRGRVADQAGGNPSQGDEPTDTERRWQK